MGSMKEAFDVARLNSDTYIVEVEEFKKNHKKLNIEDQVKALKDKGITFDLMSEKDAKIILSNINYYHKITLFRRNFKKEKVGEDIKYENLDFFYLNKIASKDMQLRYLLLQMCLDIEHALKTNLMGRISEDDNEDGYTIVHEFIQSMTDRGVETDIDKIISIAKKNENYQHNLYKKNNNKDMIPIWVLIEFMSFSQVIELFLFYYKKREWLGLSKKVLGTVLISTKNIRNTCAHSSPILFELLESQLENQPNVVSKFAEESKIKRSIRKYLKFNDIICLFYAYDILIQGKGSKLHRYETIDEFYNKCKKDLSYLSEENPISMYLDSIKKLLDRNKYVMDNSL